MGYSAFLLAFIFCTLGFASEQLKRLDPHGSAQVDFHTIQDLNNKSECSICHSQNGQQILLNANVKATCSNCHNSAPHSGVAEHLRAKVTCLDCHSPHRFQAQANPSPHQLRKSCTECHEQFSKDHKRPFQHQKHVTHFQKLGATCTDCHSFALKSKTVDALSAPVASGKIKASKLVCQQCHGFAVDSKFAHSCHLCHNQGKNPALDHPLNQKVQCLNCHKQNGQKHLSLKFAGSPVESCSSCHQDKRIKHRPLKMLQNQKGMAGLHLEKSRLTCLSCHSAHSAANETHLLKAPLENKKLCASCHGKKADHLFETFHQRK